jgi:hypothetical protein
MTRMKIKFTIALLAMFGVFFMACEEEALLPPSVFTEEVVFSSGEKVILSGRLLSNEDIFVEDHGFQISESADFINNLIASLGERSVPGRFVSEYAELDIQKDYFIRAYILLNGETLTGNALMFSTLKPKVADFSPKEGSPNNKIIIEGVNFTNDAFVLWNGDRINVNKIEEESFIEFTVPSIGDLPYAEIQVVNQSDTIQIEDRFEYIVGEWTDGVTIEDPFKNIEHIYFEDEGNFYYGLGLSTEVSGPSQKLFQLNKETYARTEIFFTGVVPVGAFYTKDGFFGSGSAGLVKNQDVSLSLLNGFYRFLDGEIIQLANSPVTLYRAAAISTEDAVYLYGGENQDREPNIKIYKYTIATGEWTEIGLSPKAPSKSFPHFAIDDEHYFIFEDRSMMSYSSNSNAWSFRADFPNEVEMDGIAIELNGLGYVGLQDISRRVFEYKPNEDRWRKLKTISDINPSVTLGSWVKDDKITVMRTNIGEGKSRFLWTLDPKAF